MTAESGILVVDKPAGLTSHQVVGRARRALGTRKIGHAGTLDPMATGVLVLGVNRGTRLLGHLALSDKRYLATIRLGQSSTTDDAEGELTTVADASQLTLAQLDAAAASLRGSISQVPSTFSAIKVAGRRAYDLARRGEAPKLAARQVEVSLLDFASPRPHDGLLDVDAVIECSSGTYVRAIARDLGELLGVGGHLTRLRRERVGQFSLADAVELDEGATMLSLAQAARRSFACLEVSDEIAAQIRVGRPLSLSVPAAPTGMISLAGELLALYQPSATGATPMAVLVGGEPA